jgi:shikimate kinase
MLKHVILFGLKGCGKSFWGERLAHKLNLPFIDTDRCIEQRCGETCHSFYKREGEEAFRSLEHQVIVSLVGKNPAVIALGGGTMVAEKNQKILVQIGKLIYLQASLETLKKRILKEPLPAFLDAHEKEASFEAYYKKRLIQCEQIGAETIQVEQENVLERLTEIALNG